ncbi:F0F1 ATP synthase subunit B [soil metagenome]|jgi:F-type H+-transporting ATPase subunit b
MELVTPGIGLIFWTTITFIVVLFLLNRFAWKPILRSLNDREARIEDSLRAADRARLEMQNLKSENEKLLAQARIERDKILKEATEAGNRLVEMAKEKATQEGNRMIEQARETINNEKNKAMTEINNQAAILSIEIAERILKRELKDPLAQQQLVKQYIGNINLN